MCLPSLLYSTRVNFYLPSGFWVRGDYFCSFFIEGKNHKHSLVPEGNGYTPLKSLPFFFIFPVVSVPRPFSQKPVYPSCVLGTPQSLLLTQSWFFVSLGDFCHYGISIFTFKGPSTRAPLVTSVLYLDLHLGTITYLKYILEIYENI